MNKHELNRRDFHRLTMAAFGGVVAGAAAGCGEEKPPPAAPGLPVPPQIGQSPPKGADGNEVAASESEPHACHGLNACKNQGASGKNDCAGQGTCATKSWHHSCGGQNECKGQGGCGENATQNECKTQGACHIPLMDPAWKKARAHFTEKMEKAGKKVGIDPGKPKEG